jgi:hypothetical protein
MAAVLGAVVVLVVRSQRGSALTSA